MKFAVKEMLMKLPLPANEKWKEGVWDIESLRKRKVSLVFFAPVGSDYQSVHEEDEFYIIASGKGGSIIGKETFSCAVSGAFYVPAKTPHHFENFSDDFAS